ncbi:MAG: ABC transporter permease [Defluviitaleaceae bacterium]|nr:ABC transporter permease [Defluviitaleaceae bacterium]
MRKTYMLAKANITKMKIQGIILVVLLLISSLMLNLGLMLAINFQSFLGNMTLQLGTSDAFYTLPYVQLTDEVRSRIENHEQVISLNVYDGIVVPAEIPNWRSGSQVTIFFRNREVSQAVSRWLLVSDMVHNAENPVFVPYGFRTIGAFSLGDTMEMTVNGIPLTFTVAGFTEDILFSNSADTQFAFYVTEYMYVELLQNFSQYHAAILFADVYGNQGNVEFFIREIFDEGVELGSSLRFITRTYEMLVGGRILLPSILSIMVIVFAFIIVIVCLTMIHFRISNSIEEDMPAIGSLKATGFTSWQIRTGLLGQYLMVALFGAIAGVPLSYAVMPFIRGVIAMQTGLFWQQGFDFPLNTIAVSVIAVIVSVLVLIGSRKIKSIDPVVAIRGGVSGHNFKRNHLPLDSTKLSLNLALGSKVMFQNVRQSIALFIVFAVIAFTGIFFVGIRHMATAQSEEYMALTGAELSDVVIQLRPNADSNYIRNTISTMNGVWQAVFIDNATITVGNEQITTYVMDDFAKKTNPSIYRGRYPIHRNEIALSGFASDILGVGVDDILRIGASNTPFVITGLTQGQGATNEVAFVNISITTAGIEDITQGFRQQRLGVYLEDGVCVNEFMTEATAIFENEILSAVNWRDMLEAGAVTVTSILVLLSTVMLGFAIVVILLVLYFIVGAVIVRRYRYLGIQKAMGYTTFELMQQVSISFLLPLIAGISLGAAFMALTFNNIAAIIMTPLGIRQANFDVPYIWVTLASIALAAISYITILVITRRIRKISAYDLVR